jgi:flagella basal body P-ring formation protein FlgA
VLVAARDLPRGSVLTAGDVERRPGSAAAGAAAPGPGWVTRRVIRAGEVLREPAVAPPDVVRAGETVHVVWQRGGVQLSLRGTAARSAGAGERVAVRIGTGWRLEGVAAGEGIVRIEPEQEGAR